MFGSFPRINLHHVWHQRSTSRNAGWGALFRVRQTCRGFPDWSLNLQGLAAEVDLPARHLHQLDMKHLNPFTVAPLAFSCCMQYEVIGHLLNFFWRFHSMRAPLSRPSVQGNRNGAIQCSFKIAKGSTTSLRPSIADPSTVNDLGRSLFGSRTEQSLTVFSVHPDRGHRAAVLIVDRIPDLEPPRLDPNVYCGKIRIPSPSTNPVILRKIPLPSRSEARGHADLQEKQGIGDGQGDSPATIVTWVFQ